MADKTGAARLRQAIENQASAGEACFSLPMGEATAICDECDDELARLSWAKDVPAPKDADGVLVPLDATELYTDEGEMVDVRRITFNGYLWHVWHSGGVFRLGTLHRSEQDSWEKLEKDISKSASKDICGYFGFALNRPCSEECPARDVSYSCAVTAMRDVARRAKALAERDAKEASRD